MSELFSVDSEFHLPDFTLVSASAGCGKTTALSHRFIQLLASGHIPNNGLRNILAITFTNNAAQEMKQRILGNLKRAHIGDKEVLAWFRGLLDADESTIRSRAGILVDRILDEYSDLQVQTIDSFLARIMKVSALDFGLRPDFAIALESGPILNEAFELLAQELTHDAAKRGLLEQLVTLINENQPGKSAFIWNPYAKLAEMVKNVYTLVSAHPQVLAPPPHAPSLKSLESEAVELVRAIDAESSRSGFDKQLWFSKIVDCAITRDFDGLLRLDLERPLLKKSKGESFESWSDKLRGMVHELKSLLSRYVGARSQAYYRPYVEALQILREMIEKVKRRRGEVFIGEANKMLADSLSADLIPEIYFSLGERINHFLIDEFQDTSPIQWAILRPLIENSLAARGSLFLVGDTKQSIFTFRGADWQIMRRMSEAEEFASVACRRMPLLVNYRSKEAVVKFSENVFQEIVPRKISPEIADLSGLASFKSQILPTSDGKGRVEVFSFEHAEDEPEAPEKRKFLEILRDCRKRGYSYRDIAILTPKNDHVVEASRWLNEAGIRFISHSSLDIRTRTITGELLALLKFLDSPIDDLSFASFVLGKIFGASLSHAGFTGDVRDLVFAHRSGPGSEEPLYAFFREKYPDLWNVFFESLFSLVGYLPLYDLVSEVYSAFDIARSFPHEEGAVIKLLEVIRNFEDSGRNSLKDFLLYAGTDPEDSWNIDVSAGEDAVTVMTVHKAKGLGFRVLIVLLYDAKPLTNNLFIEESPEGIRLLRITRAWADRSDFLQEIYTRGTVLRQVDDLNKLYVALTRARDEMYVLSVKADKPLSPSLFLPGGGFSSGRLSPVPQAAAGTDPHVPLAYPRSRGVAGSPDKEWIGRAEVQRGEAVHAILGRIQFLVDADAQLSDALASLSLDAAFDQESLKTVLSRFLKTPEVSRYFEAGKGRRILNEQEIVSPKGRLYRMDRMVLDPEAVTVIDYKTGAEQSDYDEQVKGYMELVRELYPRKQVYGALAYVDLQLVRSVR